MKGRPKISPTGWWIAGLLVRNSDPERAPFWNNYRLVRATGWREAFHKALAMGAADDKAGRSAFRHPSKFLGVTDLAPIHDAFEEGGEMLWQELWPDGSEEDPSQGVYTEAEMEGVYESEE